MTGRTGLSTIALLIFLCSLAAQQSSTPATYTLKSTPKTITTAAGEAQRGPAHSTVGHVTLTDSESLWREGFADCDLGYYALLPNGFVAHGNHPPNAIHGFLVGLPNTGTTKAVTVEDQRFIRIAAEYNSVDLKSLKESADYAID